jgi:hypothetical protein
MKVGITTATATTQGLIDRLVVATGIAAAVMASSTGQ